MSSKTRIDGVQPSNQQRVIELERRLEMLEQELRALRSSAQMPGGNHAPQIRYMKMMGGKLGSRAAYECEVIPTTVDGFSTIKPTHVKPVAGNSFYLGRAVFQPGAIQGRGNFREQGWALEHQGQMHMLPYLYIGPLGGNISISGSTITGVRPANYLIFGTVSPYAYLVAITTAGGTADVSGKGITSTSVCIEYDIQLEEV
jgi:hypothetical protein